jgi:hypothetical protein
MAPPVAPKNQSPFDDEILLLDIIQFFKDHFKRILFFIILGGLIGFLYGKLADPVYDGSVLVSPALIAGNFVVDPKITLTKLGMNSYYSKESFLACNPIYYKDKDKDIDFEMGDILKRSITNDGKFIQLTISHSNKDIIHACLESVVADISASQKIITEPLVNSKKLKLSLTEEKLKYLKQFYEDLNIKQIKNLNITDQRFATNILYANIIFNTSSEMKALQDQINTMKTELSSEQTNDASKILPVSISQKNFPSMKLGSLLGLFLGSVLGFFVCLFRANNTISKAR